MNPFRGTKISAEHAMNTATIVFMQVVVVGGGCHPNPHQCRSLPTLESAKETQ